MDKGTYRTKIYTINCSACTFVVIANIQNYICDIDVFCTRKDITCTELIQNQNCCKYTDECRDLQQFDYGQNANMLTISDFHKITKDLTEIFRFLSSMGVEDFLFCPVDFRRFQATRYFVKKVCKKLFWDDYIEFSAHSSLQDRKFFGTVKIIS